MTMMTSELNVQVESSVIWEVHQQRTGGMKEKLKEEL